MNVLRFASEIMRSPYYRSRPAEAFRLAYAKWELAKNRIEDPCRFLKSVGVDSQRAIAGFENWKPTLDAMLRKVRAQQGEHGGISREHGLILFALARTIKPDIVIETGIAAGVSTAFLGAALIENKCGNLFSIELPPGEVANQRQADGALFDWPKLGVALAVPPEIRQGLNGRHVMVLEDVRSALSRLLKEVQRVDLFFHDDLHEPDHMLRQYELVWPYLRHGGALISDDVNYGWLSFAKRHGLYAQALRNVQRLAVLRRD